MINDYSKYLDIFVNTIVVLNAPLTEVHVVLKNPKYLLMQVHNKLGMTYLMTKFSSKNL